MSDQERLEEFGTGSQRNAYAVFTEELLLLKFSQTMRHLASFLELGKVRGGGKVATQELQEHLVTRFWWLREEEEARVREVDARCGQLYRMSLYTGLGEEGGYRVDNVTYPLRV